MQFSPADVRRVAQRNACIHLRLSAGSAGNHFLPGWNSKCRRVDVPTCRRIKCIKPQRDDTTAYFEAPNLIQLLFQETVRR